MSVLSWLRGLRNTLSAANRRLRRPISHRRSPLRLEVLEDRLDVPFQHTTTVRFDVGLNGTPYTLEYEWGIADKEKLIRFDPLEAKRRWFNQRIEAHTPTLV